MPEQEEMSFKDKFGSWAIGVFFFSFLVAISGFKFLILFGVLLFIVLVYCLYDKSCRDQKRIKKLKKKIRKQKSSKGFSKDAE